MMGRDGTNQRQAEAPAQGGVAALERGLAILGAFTQGRAVLSLAELAVLTGLYKSTILRLAASLMHLGYLQRQDDGRYRLGASVFPLGRIYQSSYNLRDAVEPVLRTLVARTGETASFYVRDGDSEVCLHRAPSPNPVRDAGLAEGDRFPIDDSACSLVLSAFAGAVGDDYDAARRSVVAVARPSKRVPGVAAVVCPVLGMDQKPVGALILSGPDSRFTDATVDGMRRAIFEEATTLSRLLGGDTGVFAAFAMQSASTQ